MNDFDDIPPRLKEALRGAYPRRGEVPPAVEEAILRRGRQITALRRSRWRLGLMGGIAAAASVLVAVGAWWGASIPRPAGLALVDPHDINADGQVDVRDALLLARWLGEGTAPIDRYDLNGDGKVDQMDIDLVAAAAVRLEAL